MAKVNQLFSAVKDGISKVVQPYDLALYAYLGYEIIQEEPENKIVARPGHPEDLEGLYIYPNTLTIKL